MFIAIQTQMMYAIVALVHCPLFIISMRGPGLLPLDPDFDPEPESESDLVSVLEPEFCP